MSRPFRRSILALALSLSAGAASAWAQTPTPPVDTVAEARRLFQQGVTLLDQQQFALAAESFEQSNRLRASPVVLQNLGVANRGAGRYRAAIDAFERFLANPGTRTPPAVLAELTTEVARLRTLLVTLRPRLVPESAAAAARLTLDGAPAQLASGALVLDPGRHVLEVEVEGFERERLELTLGASEARDFEVRLRERPRIGTLQVTPSEPSAVVSVDGVALGSGAQRWTGTPGAHRVEVRAAGFRAYSRSVEVSNGGQLRLDVALLREGPPAWVVPVSIVGGVLVLGGVTAGIVVGTARRPALVQGTLGVAEP